ncbi:MAG TPA: APC family permease [Gemmatimonadaceae bacterium]|nr:APC family permease [Gemmatimonadaceae bacterium]
MSPPLAPVTAAPPAPPRGLLRVLGTAFGLAITVGAVIGGGIVRTPGEIAAALPSAPLFLAVWVLGAINTLLGANVFSELGTMMPRAGGPYVYARRAFGNAAGFFVGYADWMTWCLGAAAVTLVVGEYSGVLIPALAPHPVAVDLVVLLSIGALQWVGVRSSGRTQEITSALKALALLGLVAAAFLLPHPRLAAPSVSVPSGLALVAAFGIAMQGVVFTYESYFAVVYCGEEMRDPGREIPRSMFRGVWLVIAIYLLINIAYVAVVPVPRMAGDPFVGGTLTRALMGRAGDAVIRVIMIVSVIGTINAILMVGTRTLLAMSRDGVFPRAASRINAGGTPHLALGAMLGAVVLVIVGLRGSFQAALALSAIFILVRYSCCFAALFALRWREPDAPRPFRARGYPLLPVLALLATLALLCVMVTGSPTDALIVLALLLLSWPLSRASSWLGRRSGADV